MKTSNKTKKAAPAKSKKKAIVLTTLAVSAAGILGYFGWQYYKKKKQAKQEDLDEALKPEVKPVAPVINDSVYIPKPKPVFIPKQESSIPKSGFPLKRGSKGEKVRALQQSLIDKYGKKIMPRYGADGDFGSETINALKKLNLPTVIDESTYNVLVQGSSEDKSNLGQKLYQAAVKRDFNTALSLLKKISSKEDYRTVSDQFKTYYLNGVRQTLVNGMLNVFNSDAQKQAIRFEFIRMGLQYDGNKWSLSGFDGRPLMTTQPTKVWINATTGVDVAPRTVLGNEVSRKLDYTLFENRGKYFLVQSKTVKHL